MKQNGSNEPEVYESKYLRELIIHGGVDATHAEDRRNLIHQMMPVHRAAITVPSLVPTMVKSKSVRERRSARRTNLLYSKK